MLNPSLKEFLIAGESKYTLATVISKRARQIIEGSKPLIETNSQKPVTIALEELLEGKLEYEVPNSNSQK
ncbi:MAG: DNA-directed RNA polymerase subunit omega [Tissierellia bacterium]|nr:DNA-directed RNA polymerase subunit omega [Tissierellia bacterium]MDD4725773.1 DNA-directed RNA polymerase subunit omega [Tissierellia bacterium]